MTEVWALGSDFVRIAASIVLVGFLPGFSLIQLLFPRADFDQIERFFLVVLSSLATTCLLAYALTWTDAGLTPRTLVLFSTGFTGICLLASIVKVGFVRSENGQRSFALLISINLFQQNQFAVRSALFKVGGLVLLGITSLVLVSNLRSQAMPLTEFYVTPEHLDAEQVRYWPIRDGVMIPLEVVNREGRTVNYRLEARTADQEVQTAYQNTLRHAQTWSLNMSVPLSNTNKSEFIDLLLFENEKQSLIAELRIWLSHSAEEVRGEKDSGS